MAAAVGCVLLLGCGSADDGPRDAAAAKEVAADYIAATESRDERAISALVAPGVDAAAAIAERLALYGGRRVADTSVSYTTGGPLADVVITDRTASGKARTERLLLVAEDDRWYVALGQARQARPSASATPP